jgi:hypothetical protein
MLTSALDRQIDSGGCSVSRHPQFLRRLAPAATAIAAATATLASPAAAMPGSAGSALAKPSCGDMPYQSWTRADPDNNAGLVFRPDGDVFHVWDNARDNQLVHVRFNYAGVNDRWKHVVTPSDGGQQAVTRNVSERYAEICFQVRTDRKAYLDSPIVRYTTRP